MGVLFNNNNANATLARKTQALPQIREGDPCTPGKMYKVECNTCRCTREQTLMCTKMACMDWKSQIKLNEGKKSLREDVVKNENLLLPKVKKGVLCKPGKLYRSKCKRCFCSDDHKILCSKKQKEGCEFDKQGRPLPIKTPEDIRPSFRSDDMADVQTLSKASDKCEPGKSYKVDCNFCSCLDNHNLLCQKRMCISYDDMIRLAAKEMSGKPCDTSAPSSDECQKCDCVNGKTDCREVPHCNMAGKQLLAQGEEPPAVLDTTYTKCVPNSIYKTHCNKCYCQPDGSLRCTQKTCLNYAQVKQLEKQRLYLEKHGL